MVKTKKFVMVKRFEGEPKLSDFRIEEEELRAIKEGEFLCKAEWLSVDPYMRLFTAAAYAEGSPIGNVMIGSQVAVVIESKHPEFKVGQHIVGYFGWQIYTISDGNDCLLPGAKKPYVIPDLQGQPLSLALGALGMPGNTAYFGLLETCHPKEGETVVVTGAAGAVGSLVGQIAKIKGCRAIGVAGSDTKCKWLKDELKFDAAFNYKTTSVKDALKEAAPDGVDCYFDNVGGQISSDIIHHMKTNGRIAVCGAISSYNDEEAPKVTAIQLPMIVHQLKMEGIIVHKWNSRWNEGIMQNLQWIKEGKLKCKETIIEGFENMPQAFIGLLRGENIGKAVVKV